MVLLTRARDRRAGAEAAVCHHDRRAARERSERGLLARRRAVGRPGAQDDGAGDDVVDAADERRRERPLLRADPRDARHGGALFRHDEAGDHAAETRRLVLAEDEPGEVRQRRRLLRGADDRVVADLVCRRDRPHAPLRPVLPPRRRRADRRRPAPASRARSPRRAPEPESGPTTPMCRPSAARVVVVAAAWSSPPRVAVTAASQRAGEHEQSRRRPHAATKAERGEPCGPPRPRQHLRGRSYLTVAGMPLILPAFSSLYCAATLRA